MRQGLRPIGERFANSGIEIGPFTADGSEQGCLTAAHSIQRFLGLAGSEDFDSVLAPGFPALYRLRFHCWQFAQAMAGRVRPVSAVGTTALRDRHPYNVPLKRSRDGGRSGQDVRKTQEVWAIGFGKATPGKAYPTLYIAGLANGDASYRSTGRSTKERPGKSLFPIQAEISTAFGRSPAT